MSGRRSRSKGARGELELAAALTAAGYPARRGQQHRGGPDSPDVLCEHLPGFHVEVKRTEALRLYPALAQARREAPVSALPVVMHRKNRQEWVAIMNLDDWLALVATRAPQEER